MFEDDGYVKLLKLPAIPNSRDSKYNSTSYTRCTSRMGLFRINAFPGIGHHFFKFRYSFLSYKVFVEPIFLLFVHFVGINFM